VEHFLKPCLKYVKAKSPVMKSWPLLANQRCGAWYTGSLTKSSCYFKSVDGHVGTWNFSLKRLNLEVFRSARKAGGCWIVDASRSKEMPDSFSRTIPIWSAVLNRIILKYRQAAGYQNTIDWDRSLYTPKMISHEERNAIIALLDDRVEELFTSGVILQPHELTQLHKPLRPVYITEETFNNRDEMQHLDELANNYCLIVCVTSGFRSHLPKDVSFTYSSGAGDDNESWSRGLTPDIFWKKKSAILKLSTNDQVEALVDQLVHAAKDEDTSDDYSFHAIGESGMFIGTRRAGKPPECWECFDAILNVSMLEYEEMDSETPLPESCYYLQLPVEEGKRDKTELERWLAVGITFICFHLVQGRRVLVHCAQGRDRSVAVVLATVVLFCSGELTTLRSKLERYGVLEFVSRWSQQRNLSNTDGLFYKQSGLTKTCVDSLMGRAGRDKLLDWCKESFGPSTSLATKSTIRIALQMIQAHRPMASPSRNTLQKLNRFFMSDRTMYDSSAKLFPE
jgi:tRNA A64-2'-O-ribosylphosphate transferase